VAGKAKPLTVRLFLIKDGKTEQIDRIPDDVGKIMCERIGKRMSEYYARHPEEYKILCEAGD